MNVRFKIESVCVAKNIERKPSVDEIEKNLDEIFESEGLSTAFKVTNVEYYEEDGE